MRPEAVSHPSAALRFFAGTHGVGGPRLVLASDSCVSLVLPCYGAVRVDDCLSVVDSLRVVPRVNQHRGGWLPSCIAQHTDCQRTWTMCSQF